MDTVQLVGVAAVVLVGGVVLALLINLFRQMARFALAVGLVLGLVGLLVGGALVVDWPTMGGDQAVERAQVAQVAAVQVASGGAMSAALAVRRFAVGVFVFVVVVAVAAVVGSRLWQDYQKGRRRREMMEQAQVYALLGGQQRQALAPGMGRRMGQQGGNVYVMGGHQQEEQPVGGELWV